MRQITCRMCQGPLRFPSLSLPDTPLANEFLTFVNQQDVFPLRVCACGDCGHYQLDEQVDPERMFRHYLFVAGTSPVNVQHFYNYAESVKSVLDLKEGSKVLDIASNDGTLLKHFQNMKMSVLGVDPAKNLAMQATSEGIRTIPEFFNAKFAAELAAQEGKFDLVTANNVYAHIPDLKDFALGVKEILSPNGAFVFEVSYFVDVCNKTLFDTCYHEHTSYHTVTPLVKLFNSLDMDLFFIQRINTHGGSIRCFVGHKTIANEFKWEMLRKSSVVPMMSNEQGIDSDVKHLQANIRILGLELREKLREVKSQGKKIVVYGTPAKATTLMYALNIDEKWIEFAVDDNPLKQGTFMPGKRIPVGHPSEIFNAQPDYILVLAWNFADSIIEKCKSVGYKGKFIIPLPELKVV